MTERPECTCSATTYAGPNPPAKAHGPYCPIYREYRRRLDAKNAGRRDRYSALRSLGMKKTPYGWE